MFTDLTDAIANYYDLSESQKEELLAEINQRGAKNKEAFKAYLSQLGYESEKNRVVYYEALWKKSSGWDDVIYEELASLLAAAEKGDQGAIDECDSIMYLTMLDDMTSTFYEKTLHLLTSKLSSDIPAVRINCGIAMLEIHEEEKTLTKEQLIKVQALLNDDTFKTRINIYSDLKDMKLLPANFKLSMLDRIRAKLTGKKDLLK